MKQLNLEKYQTLAERYTKALWEISEERNEVEKFSKELSEVTDIISQNPDIESFFVSPIIKIEDKKEILQKSFKEKVDEEIYNFLCLLLDKNRIFLLSSIRNLFEQKVAEKQNILNVEAKTVIPLDENMKAQLSGKLEKITGKHINIINITDESIIGGVVLRFGSNVIDGSIQTQLKSIQKQLI